MNPNKWKVLSLIIQVIGGVLVLCCFKYKVVLCIGISIFSLGVLLETIKWRCPYCRKSLWGKGIFIVKWNYYFRYHFY